jgi:hypothetical protein
MSWRKGAALFRDIWPLILKHVPDEEREWRVEFTADMLKLFLDCDADHNDFFGIHSEVDQALAIADPPL